MDRLTEVIPIHIENDRYHLDIVDVSYVAVSLDDMLIGRIHSNVLNKWLAYLVGSDNPVLFGVFDTPTAGGGRYLYNMGGGAG